MATGLARCLDEHIIPHSIGTWQLSDDGDYAASLETKLHGLGLHRAPVSELIVEGLGSFLSVLRCVNVKGLEEILGIQISLIPFPNLKVLRESAIEAWTRLVERGQVSEEDIVDQGPINGLLEEENHRARKDTAPVSEYHPALIHNDVKGEHILIYPQSGRITGILDWADAGIGNAAADIAGLVLTVGGNIAKEIAREAGYGENQILQGVLQARCECVLRLDNRLNGDDRLSPMDLLQVQLFLSLGLKLVKNEMTRAMLVVGFKIPIKETCNGTLNFRSNVSSGYPVSSMS